MQRLISKIVTAIVDADVIVIVAAAAAAAVFYSAASRMLLLLLLSVADGTVCLGAGFNYQFKSV